MSRDNWRIFNYVREKMQKIIDIPHFVDYFMAGIMCFCKDGMKPMKFLGLDAENALKACNRGLLKNVSETTEPEYLPTDLAKFFYNK